MISYELMEDKLQKVKSELIEMSKLASALAVLGWDQEVNLPKKAHEFRGEVNAALSSMLHQRLTAPEFVALVEDLSKAQGMDEDASVIAKETWRDVSRAVKIPADFVEEMARLTTTAFQAWADARAKSDFKLYQPVLERMVELKKRQAELLGYKDSPYDALLDEFEPGMTASRLTELFTPLAATLSTLIKQVDFKAAAELPKFDYPIEKQKSLNEEISKALGYDLDAGRIDASPHPFTTSFHPTDVRVTTRYAKDNFTSSTYSIIHEVGHALYEQGLPAKQFGNPLGEAVSLGIHESQSRGWENLVGRSKPFVQWLNTLLVKHFGELPYSADELYIWLNRVKPSLIRTEADEVTYNLHIILRFEIEVGLMEGKIKISELPTVWNQKIKDYLNIDVPDDARGVLQDVHWAHGGIGYFPTYALGNLYAAQFFASSKKALPDFESKFAQGEFSQYLQWLRKNIHSQGRRYNPEELVLKVTGEQLDSKYLIDHLQQKIKLQA